MTLEELEAEAAQLPEDARILLVDRLTASLAGPVDPEIEQAWAVEAERRLDELLQGKVKGIPAAEVLAGMRRRAHDRNRVSSAGPDGG